MPEGQTEVPNDPELSLQRAYPLDQTAKVELVEWSKRLRSWQGRWTGLSLNPSSSRRGKLIAEYSKLMEQLYNFNVRHGIVEPQEPPLADPLARLRKECIDAYELLDQLELTPLGQRCFKETDKVRLAMVRKLYDRARQLVRAGRAKTPPEEPGLFTDKGAALRAIDRVLRWLAELPMPPATQGTQGQMESSPGAEVEGLGRSITVSAEADVKQSEGRATKDKRIDERLGWDDETLTIRLDDKQWHIDNPKAYHVYKNIAIHTLAGRGKIQKVGIGSEVKGVQGRKTIPLLLKSLPKRLYQTVQVDSQGYWIVLRPKKRGG